MPRLMIIDGTSLMCRAFHALPPLTTADGTPTAAVVGFANILLRLLRQYRPEWVAVAFDKHRRTFRSELFAAYKGTRAATPDEFKAQVPILIELLDALGIQFLEMDGYEADDLIGTLARQADVDAERLIVSGDRDTLQLIDARTKVLYPHGMSDVSAYDTEAFQAQYGFEPLRLIDFKALLGDSSDNIPGVAGIGEVSAKKLIAAYGTLDGVYANLEALPKGQRAKLVDGRESAYLSYRLATIVTDAPLAIDVDALRPRPDDAKVDAFCRRYEMTRLRAAYDAAMNAQTELALDLAPVVPTVDVKIEPKKPAKKLLLELEGSDPRLAIAECLLEREPLPEDSLETLTPLLAEAGLWQLYSEVEVPLIEVLAAMRRTGIYVNRERLADYAATVAGTLAELERAVHNHAGREFNLQSPKQLAEVLFDELRLPLTGKKRSTDAATLEALRGEHPIVDEVLAYRFWSKLKSTYLDGLAKLLDGGGRVHTQFTQTQTATGRLSSLAPNLQNIPVRTEAGRAIRDLFEPHDGYGLLLSADYSQIELRILAHLSGDERFIAAFTHGDDVHAMTAATVFKVPLAAVTSEQRRRAKAVNFGVVYGISAFGLSQQIGATVGEAAAYIDGFYEQYPQVKAFMEGSVSAARTHGFVTSMYGRRRHLPLIHSRNFRQRAEAERMAMNTPIQATAADLMKLAMLKVARELAAKGLRSRLLLQVHDELLLEVVREELAQVEALVRAAMEGVAELRVPLVVDVSSGATWGTLK